MSELNSSEHQAVTDLSEQGNQYFDAGEWDQSAACFRQALQILPPPLQNWEAATWLLTSLGDAFYHSRDYQAAFDALLESLRCPNGLGNPFIHLRIGQCRLRLGDETRALDDLIRAYMGGGSEIFEGEEQTFDFLKARVSL